MKILKFGGTSLSNAEKFLSVTDIIEKKVQHEQIAVVLSAPAKITNYLLSIIEKINQSQKVIEIITIMENIFFQLIQNLEKKQSNFDYYKIEKKIKKEFEKLKNIVQKINFLKKCPDHIHAVIISRGEILSILVMQSILQSKKYKTTVINPVKYFVSTGDYLNSKIDIFESKKNINTLNIHKTHIILMPGFIAGNKKKELVLLGRNGSDYSAAILSVCLHAKSVEIWTDVDGIFTCDPRIVPNAILLKSISYKEAMELAYFGAKVIHPHTIEPISQFNIPCFIKNTEHPDLFGTVIHKEKNDEYLKGISYINKISMLNVSGKFIKNHNNVIARIFSIILKKNITILLITQSSSENKINLCFFENDLNKVVYLINQEFKIKNDNELSNFIDIKKNLSMISIVGTNIHKKTNIASKIFSSLSNAQINVLAIAQGSSKYSISFIIQEKYFLHAINNVHEKLFFNKKIIHVFLIGIGGIGRTLINQILQQKKFLDRQNIEIKISYLANSKKIFTTHHEIDLLNWEKNFNKSKKKFNLEVLEKIIKNNRLPNSVIVDCTSDQNLSEQYVNFLNHNFHIVTSNKKANTGNFSYYYQIRKTALKKQKKFLYETNVGAGLPIIETLQNLFKTGDRLIRFKGILSGSLSFIFGKLEEGLLFSEATKEAKKLGFTEPNPCDDLSGIDIARKLLILAREAGYKTELKDITIEPLLPNHFKKIQEINKFLSQLTTLDAYFFQKTQEAHNKGNVLRYIGTIEEDGTCFVKLKEINVNDPLYKVKNGENALAFYTNYYNLIPLVIRGYGAGHNVTASGVFSDLLRIL